MIFSPLVNFIFATASMIPFFGPPIPPAFLVTEVSGCKNPTVRKEWRTLSSDEHSKWIGAIKCLANLPHNPSVIATQFMEYNPPLNISSSYYDDFVFTHMDLGEVVHATGRFFPWHRAYVHTLETAMKRQCNYQGVSPYWNWSIDAADFYNSPMFANSDPESGLGGWGDPYADASVLDGAFSATSGFALSYPYPHTLKRNFTLRPFMDYPDPEQWHVIPDKMANESFSSEQVSRAIDSWVGDFRGFQTDVEAIQGPHFSVHTIMGGDMSGLFSLRYPYQLILDGLFPPNDPIFFLHHAMVDKIWYEWQRRHPENLDAFSGGSIQAVGPAQSDMYPVGTPPDLNRTDYLPSNGLFFNDITIEDVLSTTGGYLCYIYE